MRLHPHGPGRLQRRAAQGRLDRAPFHGHHRGRQMAAPPGARLDAGDARGRAGARARERDRLLLRPQSRRQPARQGVRRPDLRPHRPQGRPHRHRDHQPADGAGVGAPRHRPAGGASRARPHPLARRRLARRRAVRRHPQRRAALHRGRRGAARDRRRPDDVPLPHAVRRQEHGRHRHGAARSACRCATWRWCSSTRPACSPAPTRA